MNNNLSKRKIHVSTVNESQLVSNTDDDDHTLSMVIPVHFRLMHFVSNEEMQYNRLALHQFAASLYRIRKSHTIFCSLTSASG